jgi:hypothetical protein
MVLLIAISIAISAPRENDRAEGYWIKGAYVTTRQENLFGISIVGPIGFV